MSVCVCVCTVLIISIIKVTLFNNYEVRDRLLAVGNYIEVQLLHI